MCWSSSRDLQAVLEMLISRCDTIALPSSGGSKSLALYYAFLKRLLSHFFRFRILYLFMFFFPFSLLLKIERKKFCVKLRDLWLFSFFSPHRTSLHIANNRIIPTTNLRAFRWVCGGPWWRWRLSVMATSLRSHFMGCSSALYVH